MPGVEPGTLFHTGWICDSSPKLSEVSHFYDILNFFKEHELKNIFITSPSI